jgi:hypothetical protein
MMNHNVAAAARVVALLAVALIIVDRTRRSPPSVGGGSHHDAAAAAAALTPRTILARKWREDSRQDRRHRPEVNLLLNGKTTRVIFSSQQTVFSYPNDVCVSRRRRRIRAPPPSSSSSETAQSRRGQLISRDAQEGADRRSHQKVVPFDIVE